MAVRNCAEVGRNLQTIVSRLLENQNLLKYLYYTDKDPLSNPDLTTKQKESEIFDRLVRITPRVAPEDFDLGQSMVSIRVVSGNRNNDNREFKNVNIAIEVFVPLKNWIIKESNLRPFSILGELQKSLDGKTIDGVGKLTGGDFDLNFLTDEMSCYEQTFSLISYD